METFQHELLPLSNCLNLEFRNFFFGVSEGDFVTRYPYNRLLFSFGSRGATTIGAGADTLEFKPGMWLLIPAFLEARHSHRGSRHLSIHFNFSVLRGVEILSFLPNLFRGENAGFSGIAREIVESPDPLRFVCGVQRLCRDILFEVLNGQPVDLKQLYSGFGKYEKLTGYLHDNCDSRISVSDMAKVMDMGEQNFARRFSADTGVAPGKFLSRILASRAAELLINTELSVKEIADQMGFCNEFYFSRFFKRHFDLSPSGFRQNIRRHESTRPFPAGS